MVQKQRPIKVDIVGTPDTGTDRVLEASRRLTRLAEFTLNRSESWEEERAEWARERGLLRAMIDQVPDYLFVKDRQSRFVLANKAVAIDLGRKPSEVIGKTDLELHRGDLAAQFLEDERKVIETGLPMVDKEEFILLPNGEKRWLSTTKVPLRDDDGTIAGLIGIARDVSIRKQAEEQIRFLAYFDPLTALPNRASFEKKFEEIVRALDPQDEASLMLVDLDRFKHVNDTFGHGAGDELLRCAAERLMEVACRGGSLAHVARLGGDEFVVLRQFASRSDERSFYDSLIERFGEPFEIMGTTVYVGASIGVAKVNAKTTPLSALREADIALYEAKANGKNRWQMFESRMSSFLELRHQLEDDLRHALQRPEQQLWVAFQPVFDAAGTQAVGAEALVRWRHPERGNIPPDQFIAFAEECGLIGAIGELVIREACALLASTDLSWVAVNVSPVQLREPGFAERVLDVIEGAGIIPARVELEITEGALLEDRSQTRATIEKLRKCGIRVAIDDFGTGFSSLGYLTRFRLDKIKIDRSFISAIGSEDAGAVIKAILAVADALKMTVTAEGVESEEQRSFLERTGCHEVQGYLLSRPVSATELRKRLSRAPKKGPLKT